MVFPHSVPVPLLRFVALLAFFVAPLGSSAQPAYLVEDFRTVPEGLSSNAHDFRYFDGSVYFRAYSEEAGWEMWVSDGSEVGTRLVADLCPGACSSGARVLGEMGGRLVFRADDGASGKEPWSLRAGEPPRRLGDLCPGACDGVGDEAASLDGFLVFAGRDRGRGEEVWRTDGTAAGTERVAEVCAGPCDARPTGFATFGDRIYFAADDGVHGRELWSTDGTAAGTQLVLDLCPDCDADPQALTAVDGRLFFTADDGISGREPWSTDGTAAGTELPTDLVPGPEGSEPAAFHFLLETLYVEGDCHNLEPCFWKRQGSDLVPALEFYPEGLDERPFEPVEWRGEIYFTAGTAFGFPGGSVWATAGTVESTRLLGRFAPVDNLTPTRDALLFSGAPHSHGADRVLWFSDGSPAGTVSLSAVESGAQLPVAIAETPLGIFFLAGSPLSSREPWITDGTPEGSRLLAEVAPATSSSDPRLRLGLGKRLLFNALGESGRDGLRSTGGRPGTVETLQTSYGIRPLRVGDQAYFFRGFQDAEVWRTDGTPLGTVLTWELDQGLRRRVREAVVLRPDGPAPTVVYGDAARGQALWTLNPTTGEEMRIADLNPAWSNEPCVFSPCEEPPRLPAAFVSPGTPEGGAFLLGSEEGTTIQLWWTKGTAATTRRLHTFDTGVVLSGLLFTPHGEDLFPRDFMPFGGGVLFNAFERSEGFEPWVSDGTTTGTRPLGDLWPGAESSEARAFSLLGDSAYFFARTPEGDALWRTDGSPGGTERVVSLEWQGEPLSGVRMAAVGDRLFFSAFSRSLGEELWVSDGTAEGTRLIADLFPGPRGSAPRELTAVEVAGRWVLLFAATDGIHGQEPWVTDGEEVRLLQDLASGPDSSGPQGFQVLGPRVLFSADDGIHDRELWAVTVAAVFSSGLGEIRRLRP